MNEKKMFATRIDPEMLKKVKHLAVELEVSIASLIEEALVDLLAKHGVDYTQEQPPGNE